MTDLITRARLKWKQFWCKHEPYYNHFLRVRTCDKCGKVWL